MSVFHLERGLESGEVGRPEHDAVPGGDVNEIEVDAGAGDLAGQVSDHAGAIFDVDDDDFPLAADCEMRDGQRMLRGPGVLDEDVKLGSLPGPDARGRRDVHAGVTDRGRNLRQRARGVVDVDDQVDCLRRPPAYPNPMNSAAYSEGSGERRPL